MINISVIIPVYNREKYIAECLDSVINSNVFDKCEVILTDDGSTDRSCEIIKEYEVSYENIKLYTFPHKGVSACRNAGLRLAKGKYIYFLDSDDFIKDNYIEKLYNTITDKNCDLVFAGYSTFKSDGSAEPVIRHHLTIDSVMSGCEFLEKRMDCEDWLNQPWSAIYRKDYLIENHLFFPENIPIYEDLYYNNEILLYADRVYAITEYGYMYREHTESLVQNGVTQEHIDYCLAMMEMFCAEYYGLNKAQKHALGRVYFQFISMILYCIGDINAERKDEFYSRLNRMKLRIPLLRSIASFKEAVKWIVFCLNWNLYYRITKKN